MVDTSAEGFGSEESSDAARTNAADGGLRVRHSFTVEVVAAEGLVLGPQQLFGETDAFVQYAFPQALQGGRLGLAVHRSPSALCVPDMALQAAFSHDLLLAPAASPVHRRVAFFVPVLPAMH